jgi:hypothetical protein
MFHQYGVQRALDRPPVLYNARDRETDQSWRKRQLTCEPAMHALSFPTTYPVETQT